jgi:GNAT superfamily N-acetyltransferase
MESNDNKSIDPHVIDGHRGTSYFDLGHGMIMLEICGTYMLPYDPDEEETPAIRGLHGRILGDPGDGQEPVLLAEVSLDHVLAAGVEDFPFYADRHSHEMAVMGSDIFDEIGLSRAIIDAYGYEFNEDFVAIEEITVRPEFRGRGIGRMAIEAIIKVFTPWCGLVALIPFPIESEQVDSDSPDPVKREKELAFTKASKRLREFYERIGFRLLTDRTMTYCTELERQPTLTRCSQIRLANRNGLAQNAPDS